MGEGAQGGRTVGFFTTGDTSAVGPLAVGSRRIPTVGELFREFGVQHLTLLSRNLMIPTGRCAA